MTHSQVTLGASVVNTAKTRAGLSRMLTHIDRVQDVCAKRPLLYDMQKVQYCDPCFSLLLLRLSYDADDDIEVILPENKKCEQWLRRIGLLAGSTGKKKPKQPRATLKLRYLKSRYGIYSEVENMVDFLQQHEALRRADALKLASMLGEVLMNTFQHGAGTAYKGAMICGQNHRTSRHAMIAAIDWGKTIPITMSQSQHD